MIALEVSLNAGHVCTAGIGDLGQLSMDLFWRRCVIEGKGNTREPEVIENLVMLVGALDGRTATPQRWAHRNLAVGDHVRVRIVELEAVDVPGPGDAPATGKPWKSDLDGLLVSRWKFWRKRHQVAFEISVSGEHVCRFGVGPVGASVVTIGWGRGIASKGPPETVGSAHEHLELSALGGASNMDWWASRALSVGDEIDVHILWTAKVDAPKTAELIAAQRARTGACSSRH